MAGSVKRPYDTARRREGSEETRSRILAVARELLATHGYRATTVSKIARSADVHVDTIYALIGRKPEVLRELIERAISGSDRPLAPGDRDYVQAMRGEQDPARKLRIYAGAVCAIQGRIAPLLIALADAATTDSESQQVWSEISARRAKNMRDLVRELGPEGTLRVGVTVDEAADVIWATASSEMFFLFTHERGWTEDRYERWLADTWIRLLLSPRAGRDV